MTVLSLSLLIAAAAFAVANWISRLRHDPLMEWATKPAVMSLLLGALLTGSGVDYRAQGWVAAALVFSLIGDVCLMLPRQKFVAGLTSFLVAHLMYVGAFWPHVSGDRDAFFGAIGVAVITVAYASQILPAAGRLKLPVAAYVVVIAAMVSVAGATKTPIIAASALAFFVSDALIGWTRFRFSLAWAPVAIMVTYHAAQFGFTVWALTV